MSKTKKMEMNTTHALTAFTQYLRTMMLIDKDEEVTSVREGSRVFYLTISKEQA